MPYTSTVLSDLQSSDLQSDWQAVLTSLHGGILTPDATAGFFWLESLRHSLLIDSDVKVLAVHQEGQAVAVLPYYRLKAGLLDVGKLSSAMAVHAGRGELLVRDRSIDGICESLSILAAVEPRWGTLIVQIIVGSPGEEALRSALTRLGLSWSEVSRERSPYFELPSSWEELSKGLPQGLRYRIRKGQKDLEKRGLLQYTEVTEPDRCAWLAETIIDVERRSWKEQLGVSITANEYQSRFYQELLPRAASVGALSAHVLSLDGHPIAYRLGLLGPDRAFLALKSSFDEALADYSPGNVLMRFVIERIIERGAVLFDMMGRCDEHKMRWTDKTYEIATMAIFSDSWRGRVARWRSSVAKRLGRIKPSAVLPTRQQRQKALPSD